MTSGANWISRGWFAWEHEGYPYWGNMHHLQSWWNYRHLPNILLVHFADLLANTPAQIRRMADFLEIAATDEQISQIAQQTSLTAMRTRARTERSRHVRCVGRRGALRSSTKGPTVAGGGCSPARSWRCTKRRRPGCSRRTAGHGWSNLRFWIAGVWVAERQLDLLSLPQSTRGLHHEESKPQTSVGNKRLRTCHVRT